MDMITSDLIYFVSKSLCLIQNTRMLHRPYPALDSLLNNLQQGMSIVAVGIGGSYRTEAQVRVGKDEEMQTSCHKCGMSDAIETQLSTHLLSFGNFVRGIYIPARFPVGL